MNHRKAIKAHLKKRAWERYGLDLTNEDLTHIKQLVQTDSLLIQKPDRIKRKCGVYRVFYMDKHLHVVYNDLTNRIITFLPGA